MEFYNENHPTSKKNHICHICRQVIPKGVRYSRESGKYQGEFFSRAVCKSCYSARNSFLEFTSETEYDEWSIQDHAEVIFCDECPESNSCNNGRPLSCPKVREHYEKKTDEEWKKLDARVHDRARTPVTSVMSN